MVTKSAQEVSIGDGSLHVGDRVVYPNQGICRITGVETKQIAGHDWEMVTLSREEDSATVMVPRAKVAGIGLRKVADVAAVEEVFDQLAADGEQAQLDWKVRHRENADRMHGGGLFGTVEVLKGLHALSRIRPLPQKERELYDNARHLLVGEIAAATSIPLHVAEDNLDYALWPPVGMKRKGRTLTPASLGPPPATAVIKVSRGDDDDAAEDLGFDDEQAAPAAKAQGAEAGDADDTDDIENLPPPPPAKKPAGAFRTALRGAPAALTHAAHLEASKPAMGVARPPAAAPSTTATAPAPVKPSHAATPAAHAKPAAAATPAAHPKAAAAPAAHGKPGAAATPVAHAKHPAAATPVAHGKPGAAHSAKAVAPAKPASAAKPKALAKSVAKPAPTSAAKGKSAPATKPKPAAKRESAPVKKAAAAAAKKPAAKAKSKGKK